MFVADDTGVRGEVANPRVEREKSKYHPREWVDRYGAAYNEIRPA